MKIKNIACIASVLLASLSGAKAATTLTAWTFDNLAIAPNNSPSPSTGFGAASAVGLNNPDVQSLAGSSSGGANSWRVRGNGGNVWSRNAPIGTQGARFAASTFGYYRIKVSFDVYAATDAEANLQVQYTTEGTIWNNATITSVGTLGIITNNSATNSTVMGSYVILTNNGTTGWNNQITVDLSGISGVDNNPNFAIRMVNASSGTNCVDTTGALYNDNSGNWTFDNVVIQGISFDIITAWTFESYGTTAFVPHPVPEFGSGTATSIGFDTSYIFSDGSVGSTNKPDILANGVPFSSSGSAGQFVWRVRGQGPGNGWDTQSPIGSQGAEFDVSTVNYKDVLISFDLFSTSQGEAKMCVLYTTDGWATTNNASTLFYGANPTFIFTNSVSNPDYSPDTVTGTYFWQNVGQNFYNNFIVDLTGVPGATNNPNFAFRIVNAAQNGDCVAFNGGSYNNSSGNWRYDNVTVSGKFNGLIPPVVAYDPNATVDRPFTNTFADDAAWRAAITSIFVNGSALTNTAYAKTTPGQITFNPTNSVLLQSSGVKNIVINAAGYSSVKVTQPIAAGVAAKLAIATQPTAPSASGGTLIVNPVLAVTDKYGNGTTNPYANVSVLATVSNSVAWTLGGSTNQIAVNGVVAFTNLSATVNGSSAVSGAAITFIVSGYTNTANSTTTTNLNSSTFTIGAPPAPFTRGNLAVIQIDTVGNNNTTFSVIEIKPSAARQTTPVNIVPISATGTNALRLASAGSCGRLTLSDDGTLVSFVGFADESSATLDETFIQNRAVGTLNYTNQFTKPFSYSSISFGGSEGRSCATLDNLNWLVVDKGGLYINSLLWSIQNNVAVRTFGGTPYVETQKTASGSPIPAVYALAMDNPGSINHAIPNNLVTDPVAVDFYLISTNGGASYDILYILDQISSTSGLIKKYSLANDGSGNWVANGSFAMGNGADSLFATTNGNGSIYLYYTTGGGGTAGNSVIRLTDANGYNTPINITSSNVIYTASATTSVKGLTFAPQQIAYTNQLMPPPILTAQTFAATNGYSLITITNTPDDPLWRNSITGITVNGSPLPAAAYDTNQPGKIVFDPSQSALLQSPGSKTIVISATGYSADSVVQIIAGAAAKLAITRQPAAPAANGGALATQPVVAVQDASGNAIASTASIVAQVGAGAWTTGGTTTKAAVSGTATFTDLTATSPSAVTGATISFTSSGLTGVTSSGFNIPAPPSPTSVVFLGVAAGDASSSDVTLWTRAVDTNTLAAPSLQARVSTNATFNSGVTTSPVSADSTKDYTAKVTVTGLTPGTKYYYDFVFTSSSATNISLTGTFKTAPATSAAAAVHFAFSGDMDGLMRPYALASSVPAQNLDFYANLGDVIYENASSPTGNNGASYLNSPSVTLSGSSSSLNGVPVGGTTFATAAQLFADYSKKYREQFLPVNTGGQNCLQSFYAGQANYTFYDNHELGNRQYINGGAPPGGSVGGPTGTDMATGRGVDARNNGSGNVNNVNDTNSSASDYMNRATGFLTLQNVFLNYQPVKDRGTNNTPLDPRSHGTKQLYFAQQWGRNAAYIHLDTRDYRDLRIKTADGSADDTTAPRANNPNRTYLGKTQLAWLESTLLAAQTNGTIWKFIAISDPIDQIGPIGGALTGTLTAVNADGGKSYIGGYRAERNELMKFIADNQIRNVVFLATDDHQNRINELTYSTNGQTEVQSSYVKVPYCFSIVCGPLGATGPETITDHSFTNIQAIANSLATAEVNAGIEPIGLVGYPGLANVFRDTNGTLVAVSSPEAVDFYSPDTFNYNILDVTADGKTLTVTSKGINSTAQNSASEYDAINNPARTLFRFDIPAAEPATPPTLTVSRTVNTLALSWSPAYLTYVLQSNSASLLSPAGWANVPGVSNNSITVNIDNTKTNVFFRLIKF